MLAEQGVYGRDGGIWDPGNISLAHVISEVTRPQWLFCSGCHA